MDKILTVFVQRDPSDNNLSGHPRHFYENASIETISPLKNAWIGSGRFDCKFPWLQDSEYASGNIIHTKAQNVDFLNDAC
jgi:hypothetical protein